MNVKKRHSFEIEHFWKSTPYAQTQHHIKTSVIYFSTSQTLSSPSTPELQNGGNPLISSLFLLNFNYISETTNSHTLSLFWQDSSGMTLMDLMTSDPKAAPPQSSSSSTSSSSSAASAPTQMAGMPPPSSLGKPVTDRKTKRTTLMQIQNDTISAAKAVRANILPQKQKKRVLFIFASFCLVWYSILVWYLSNVRYRWKIWAL